MNNETHIWWSFRSRAVKLSGGGVVVFAGLLVFLYRYQPSPIPDVRATEKGKIDPGLFGALETCLETALAIAAISLIFEIFLRETYARTLRRYLRLGAALVRSGLQHVGRNPDTDWKGIIEPATTITALVRDPSQWLIPSLAHIIVAAQKRAVDVTLGFPDPDSAQLPAIAESVGLDAPTLKHNIETAVKSIQNQWQAHRPHMKQDSAMRVVAYGDIPLVEVLAADEATVCLLAQPIKHPLGEWQMSLVFEQRADQYPTTLLRKALDDLSGLNELWAG